MKARPLSACASTGGQWRFTEHSGADGEEDNAEDGVEARVEVQKALPPGDGRLSRRQVGEQQELDGADDDERQSDPLQHVYAPPEWRRGLSSARKRPARGVPANRSRSSREKNITELSGR